MKLVHWICCAALLIAGCTGALKKPNLGELYNDAASHHGPDRHPVIVIPGILGSKLVTNQSKKQVVWGSFAGGYANPQTTSGARLFALPMDEGQPLRNLHDDVVPDGVLDRLRFSLLGLPLELRAYVNILGTLGVGGFRDEGLGPALAVEYGDDHFTCFQFAYDWRRDLVESAQALHEYIVEKKKYVRREIKERFEGDKSDIKFDLVAHSMGGLVARYYLRYGAADLPADGSAPELTWAGAEHVARVILVGTPNAGSIKSLLELVNGTRFGPFLPAYPPAVLGTMPSIYQLLPRGRHQPMINAKTGTSLGEPTSLALWEKMQWGLLAEDQDRVLAQLLPNAPSRHDRLFVAKDHLQKCLKRARRFQDALDADAPRPDGVELYLFAGDAVTTRAAVAVDAESGRLQTARWGPGDGTVLRRSAGMDERLGDEWTPKLQSPISFSGVTFLFADHLGLTKDPMFADNVLFLLLERQ